MPDPNEQPASKQDLMDLEARLEKRLTDNITERISDKVQEMVRDAQTEILRGFERYARSQDIRMRKVEADYSNLNISKSLRMRCLRSA